MIDRTTIILLAWLAALAIADATLGDGPTRKDGRPAASAAGPSITSPALPSTRTLMARVERILVDAGYPAAGYRAMTPPGVFMAPGPLPRGAWGWYVPGTILLSPDQPDGCLTLTLGHEIAHDATRRLGLIGRDVPDAEVRGRFERIAAVVERELERDTGYAPNCYIRRTAAE